VAHRRLLLRAATSWPKALERLKNLFETTTRPTRSVPPGASGAPASVLQAHGPNGYSRHQTSTRRTRFLAACVSRHAEATRLAATIESGGRDRSSQSLATQRPDRGLQPVIKQIKRVSVNRPSLVRHAAEGRSRGWSCG